MRIRGRRRVKSKNPGRYCIRDFLAETVGFEPTCLSLDKTISSRSRYDHFDTSPSINSPQMRELSVISTPLVLGKSGEPGHFRNRRFHAGLRDIGAAG